MLKKFACITLATAALYGCGGSGHGFDSSGFGGLLIYSAGALYTMEQDGTNQVLVANNLFVGSMSENRRVVTSVTSGDDEIVIANADGSHQKQLTNNAAADFRPIITPDGSKIVFISDRDGNREIYIMDGDGSDQTRLTNDPAEDYFPSISADGTKILFTSKRDGNEEVYSMNLDGSSQTRLTNDPGIDTTPAWSPDGTQILFCTNRDGNYEIYRANADGSSQTRLTTTPQQEVHASWDLAGTHIFYYDDVAVRRMDPDGSNRIDLFTGGGKTCSWVYQ